MLLMLEQSLCTQALHRQCTSLHVNDVYVRTYTVQMHAEQSNGIYVCVQSVTHYCWRKTAQPAMKGASNS